MRYLRGNTVVGVVVAAGLLAGGCSAGTDDVRVGTPAVAGEGERLDAPPPGPADAMAESAGRVVAAGEPPPGSVTAACAPAAWTTTPTTQAFSPTSPGCGTQG